MNILTTPTIRKRPPITIREMCQSSRCDDSVQTVGTKKKNCEKVETNVGPLAFHQVSLIKPHTMCILCLYVFKSMPIRISACKVIYVNMCIVDQQLSVGAAGL